MAKLKKSVTKTNGTAAKKATPKTPVKRATKKSSDEPKVQTAHVTHALAMRLMSDVSTRLGADASLVDLHKALEDELMHVQDAMGEVEELMDTHGEGTTLAQLRG